MTRFRRYGVATAVVTMLAANALSAQRGIARVGWLQGCWVAAGTQRVVEEQWSAPRGKSLIGMSRTVRGDSVSEYELVIIRQRDSSLVYEAHPSGQPSATFTAIHASDSAVVFENASHDFPQRVGYRRVRGDSLIAHVEGTMGGRSRRIEFPYARARCAGP